MSTYDEALQATLEARYRAAVEEMLSLRAENENFRGKLARAEANLGDEVADAMEREADLRADLVNAAAVIAELTQERDGLVEAVRLHLEEHTETARERDEARRIAARAQEVLRAEQLACGGFHSCDWLGGKCMRCGITTERWLALDAILSDTVRQCSAQIINRSTGVHSTCALRAGHEGMHLDETRLPPVAIAPCRHLEVRPLDDGTGDVLCACGERLPF